MSESVTVTVTVTASVSASVSASVRVSVSASVSVSVSDSVSVSVSVSPCRLHYLIGSCAWIAHCKYKTPDNLMQQEVPAVALYAAINLGSGTAGCAAGPFKVTKSTHKLMQFVGGIVQEAASSGNSTVVQSMCDAVLDIAVFFTSPSSKMKEQLAQVASCPFLVRCHC